MNARKAKQLRSIARDMTTSVVQPVIRFFVETDEVHGVRDTLVPMPLEWGLGTFRRTYQDLK